MSVDSNDPTLTNRSTNTTPDAITRSTGIEDLESVAMLAKKFSLPVLGNNPSSAFQGTTPGSFANPPEIGGARTFSSPDTPGMPQPSEKTAWDFMPSDWRALDDGKRLARSVHPEWAAANA